MSQIQIFVAALFPILLSACATTAQCLKYEVPVELTGQLVREAFADQTCESDNCPKDQIFWILHPDKVVCTEQSEEYGPYTDVNELQLVFTHDEYKTKQALVGKHVVVRGKLYGKHTAHHFTDVLVMVDSLDAK